MIIIVEGIDRVGKTTLCNRLDKKLAILYLSITSQSFLMIRWIRQMKLIK